MSEFFLAYTLGLLAPLTAVCVLPLYPGFLLFLRSRAKQGMKLWPFGLLVTFGVISMMLAVGVLFGLIFSVSLSKVIQIISPIAFGILGLIGVLLIIGVDFSRFFGHISRKESKNPFIDAYLFGLFFGFIVLPCNPGFIVALLAQATTVSDTVLRLTQFVLFGLGMGTPLIALTVLPSRASKGLISFLTSHKRVIDVVAGVLLLGFALYELIFVFTIF
jgi:cytochrome c-type biogenesis protein